MTVYSPLEILLIPKADLCSVFTYVYLWIDINLYVNTDLLPFRVAVVVNGPNSYLYGSSEVMGRRQLMVRQLQSLKYRVVQVKKTNKRYPFLLKPHFIYKTRPNDTNLDRLIPLILHLSQNHAAVDFQSATKIEKMKNQTLNKISRLYPPSLHLAIFNVLLKLIIIGLHHVVFRYSTSLDTVCHVVDNVWQ